MRDLDLIFNKPLSNGLVEVMIDNLKDQVDDTMGFSCGTHFFKVFLISVFGVKTFQSLGFKGKV